MENQVNNASRRADYFADMSRWLGTWSLPPYFLLGILYHLETRRAAPSELSEVVFFFVLICLLSGALLGSTALFTGIFAFKQFKNSQTIETGKRSALTGITLGLLGILINVLFCYFLAFYLIRGMT